MNRIRLALALLGLLTASACQPAIAVSTPTPQPSATLVAAEPTDTPAPVEGAPPASVEGALTPPTHASQVEGSVLLQDGRCCVGGIEGGTVNITAAFQAQSLSGEVTEMRVANGGASGCRTEAELNTFPWEPFAAGKTYPFEGIPINWTGYYVSVQYRDAQGNRSPVYCDDVSVEGMPRPPASPTP